MTKTPPQVGSYTFKKGDWNASETTGRPASPVTPASWQGRRGGQQLLTGHEAPTLGLIGTDVPNAHTAPGPCTVTSRLTAGRGLEGGSPPEQLPVGNLLPFFQGREADTVLSVHRVLRGFLGRGRGRCPQASGWGGLDQVRPGQPCPSACLCCPAAAPPPAAAGSERLHQQPGQGHPHPCCFLGDFPLVTPPAPGCPPLHVEVSPTSPP